MKWMYLIHTQSKLFAMDWKVDLGKYSEGFERIVRREDVVVGG